MYFLSFLFLVQNESSWLFSDEGKRQNSINHYNLKEREAQSSCEAARSVGNVRMELSAGGGARGCVCAKNAGLGGVTDC